VVVFIAKDILFRVNIRIWSEVFQTLNKNNFSPRILYPAKLSFKIHGAIKIFHEKQTLKQYTTIKPPL
jgi:hypothetical protein